MSAAPALAAPGTPYPQGKTEAEWAQLLGEQQRFVLRDGGTPPPRHNAACSGSSHFELQRFHHWSQGWGVCCKSSVRGVYGDGVLIGCMVSGFRHRASEQLAPRARAARRGVQVRGLRRRPFPVRPQVRGAHRCRDYSKLRTHTALGPYGRSIPRSIGPS